MPPAKHGSLSLKQLPATITCHSEANQISLLWQNSWIHQSIASYPVLLEEFFFERKIITQDEGEQGKEAGNINSPPCLLVFSFIFCNLISSSVFIPKFRPSSENRKQLMRLRLRGTHWGPQILRLLSAQELSEVFRIKPVNTPHKWNNPRINGILPLLSPFRVKAVVLILIHLRDIRSLYR